MKAAERESAPSRARSTFEVQSVQRAVQILRAFSSDHQERTIRDLAEEVGLNRSTVSRLVLTLEQERLLRRNRESGGYQLGTELLVLAAGVGACLEIREVARPFLKELADACMETVNLAVFDEDQVVDIDQFVSSARRVRDIGRVGTRVDAHCTAVGKVFLAHLPDDDLERILARGLKPQTDRTVTDVRELKRQLAAVRQVGYATAQGELEEGLNAIAAPILNRERVVEAVVSVGGPAFRLSPDVFAHWGACLLETTSRISQAIGYVKHQKA